MTIFTNGAKLMKNIRTEEDFRMLQENLDQIQEWADKWLLEFGRNRCKTIKMGKGHRRSVRNSTIRGREL